MPYSRFPLAICFTHGSTYTSIQSPNFPAPLQPIGMPTPPFSKSDPLTLESKTSVGEALRHASLQSNLCFCLFPCFLTVGTMCTVSGFCDVWKLPRPGSELTKFCNRERGSQLLMKRLACPGCKEHWGGDVREINSPAQASSLLRQERARYRSHATVLRIQ